MMTSIGTVLLAAMLMLGVPAYGSAAAATGASKREQVDASDVGARRYHRHERRAHHPNYPYPLYYGRPVYYAPAPFLPIPPLWGYGWEWW